MTRKLDRWACQPIESSLLRSAERGKKILALARRRHMLGGPGRGLARRVTFAVLGLCWLSGPLVAHHGFEVEYDREKPVEETGVISKVEWTNPHMRVYVDVTDEKKVVTTWNLELGSPNSVYRRGWTREDLKVGDTITFKAYGGRQVLTRAVADEITLADGRPFTGATGIPQQ